MDVRDPIASSENASQLETSTAALPDGDSIGRATSLEEIITTLAKRGCADLTSSIDLDACGQHAVAGGGFCDVYRGKLHSGGDIAIKSLRVYGGPEDESQKQKILKHAARELYQWSKLKHCNILPLKGLTVFRGHISMVSEWMQNGNLSAYLRLNPQADQVHLCIDIGEGLCYIHENNMVHGDLKAANVMVSSTGVAMITDFGNAQLRDLTIKFSNTTGFAVSPRWASPELLSDDGTPHVSKMSDIWAYGMTMLEVLTGKVPFDELSDHQVYISVGVKRKHPPRPEGLDDVLWSTMVSCWAPLPEERSDIMSLNSILLEAYPDYQPHRRRSIDVNEDSQPEPAKPAIDRHWSEDFNSIPTTIHTELFERTSGGSGTTSDHSFRQGGRSNVPAISPSPEPLSAHGLTQSSSAESNLTTFANQEHSTSQVDIPENRITTGDYIITNVSTGNQVVSLSGKSDSELVGVSGDGTDALAKFKEWSVLRIALGTYLIQSPRTLWVSHETRPKKDSGVSVKYGFKEWRIKESKTKHHYTISPVGTDLYWGLSDGESGTRIVLRNGPNDSKNHWVFRSALEGE